MFTISKPDGYTLPLCTKSKSQKAKHNNQINNIYYHKGICHKCSVYSQIVEGHFFKRNWLERLCSSHSKQYFEGTSKNASKSRFIYQLTIGFERVNWSRGDISKVLFRCISQWLSVCTFYHLSFVVKILLYPKDAWF